MGTEQTIRSTIWKSFSRLEYRAMACKFISDLMGYVSPVCISIIVSYAEAPDAYGDYIFIAAAAMLVAPIVTGLCNHWFYQFVMVDGLHARTTIQAAVYAKVLRISNAARLRSTKDGGVADTITNLQSTDCRSIEMGLPDPIRSDVHHSFSVLIPGKLFMANCISTSVRLPRLIGF